MLRSSSFVGLVIAGYFVVSPLLYLMRITLGDEGSISILLRLMQPVLIIALCSSLFLRPVRLDAFALVVLSIIAYGILMGLANGFSPFDVISGSIHYIQGLLIYVWAINVADLEAIFLRLMRRLRAYYLPILTLVMSWIYVSNFALGTSFYIGIATQALLPIYFWSMATQRGALSFIVLTLTFLSGKRSVLLAILAAAAMKFLCDILRLHLSRIFVSILVLAIPILFLSISLNADFFARLLRKYDFSGGDLDYLSSGRVAEVSSAFSGWTESSLTLFFGSGFGDTYMILPDDPNGSISLVQNIHFSYGNSLLVFGPALALIFHLAIFVRIWESARSIKFCSSEMRLQQYTMLAHLVLAVFALTLYADPIFWMLLAFGRRKWKQEHQKNLRILA